MDWKTLLAYIMGSVDQRLLLRNAYRVTENQILRQQIKVRGLRVGAGVADLHFQRTPDGATVQVLRTAGPLEVQIETYGRSGT